jgi:hypothetical protein
MKRVFLFMCGLLLVVALTSCQIGYSTTPLSGTIGGQAWTFTSGTISATTGIVTMEGSIAGDSIVFIVDPYAVGEVKLEFDLFDLASAETVTLYDSSENVSNVLIEGAYEILTITDTEVTGQMNIYSDTDSMNGTFTLTVQ